MEWLITLVEVSPILSIIVGVILFVLSFIFYYHKPTRKKVDYYLSMKEEDETQAHATAQERVNLLIGAMMIFSLFVILFSSLYFQ